MSYSKLIPSLRKLGADFTYAFSDPDLFLFPRTKKSGQIFHDFFYENNIPYTTSPFGTKFFIDLTNPLFFSESETVNVIE